MLAGSIGQAGHVTGLDLDPVTLSKAADLAASSGMGDRLTFTRGDVRSLPFDDNTFDWAWSMHCVGCALLEPLLLITEPPESPVPGAPWRSLRGRTRPCSPGTRRLKRGCVPQRPGRTFSARLHAGIPFPAGPWSVSRDRALASGCQHLSNTPPNTPWGVCGQPQQRPMLKQ